MRTRHWRAAQTKDQYGMRTTSHLTWMVLPSMTETRPAMVSEPAAGARHVPEHHLGEIFCACLTAMVWRVTPTGSANQARATPDFHHFLPGVGQDALRFNDREGIVGCI